MTNFPTFTDEHAQFRRLMRDFAAKEVAPHAARWDREHIFPLDVVEKMGELGLFGLPFSEQWGGGGGDFTSLCIAVEELGYADQSMGITLSAAVGLGISPIYHFGTDAQRERWLPDLIAGRSLAAFGLTEPDGGSDAGGTRTKAVRDDKRGIWVLNGSKSFITNSGTPITSVVTATARTRDDRISCFLIPSGSKGLIIDPPYRKLGWHASDTHGLAFEDLELPDDALLGEEGRGYANFLAILDEGRVAIAALALGLARACLDMAVDYAKNRRAFGRAIGANQGLAFALSDLAVKVENSHNIVYKAAYLRDAGRPSKRLAAMAKLYTTEAAVDATRVATQVFGGLGFSEELPLARFYRDAKVLEIGEGTSEIQRMLIAREIGLPSA